MSDGDTARETVGPASHCDPEAWCSERGHYRPERPNPGVPGRGHYRTKRPRLGVPNGDITGPNGRTLVFLDGDIVFLDGDIAGQNGRGLVFTEGDITGPSGRGLVFSDGDILGPDSQHGFRRVGTVGF